MLKRTECWCQHHPWTDNVRCYTQKECHPGPVPTRRSKGDTKKGRTSLSSHCAFQATPPTYKALRPGPCPPRVYNLVCLLESKVLWGRLIRTDIQGDQG